MKSIKLNEEEVKILSKLVFKAIEDNASKQDAEETRKRAKILHDLFDVLNK